MDDKIRTYAGQNGLNIGEMDNRFFLIGLLNEFINRFQAVGDRFFEEVSWKQCFVLICIQLFEEPPSLRELSEVVGTSHQNVKQMLMKLEKSGYVNFVPDTQDKRKQRIMVTEKTEKFSQKHDAASDVYMKELFQSVDRKDLQTTVDTILILDEKIKKMEIRGVTYEEKK